MIRVKVIQKREIDRNWHNQGSCREGWGLGKQRELE